MGKCTYPQSRVYGLIEPGPVVLLTTLHKGKINVMPLSGMPGRRHVSDDSL